MIILPYLLCPVTGNGLTKISAEEFPTYGIETQHLRFEKIENGLIDSGKNYFYPIIEDILLLHRHYALVLKGNQTDLHNMDRDKKRVFDYYNEVEYQLQGGMAIYEDSSKWVDYRAHSEEYMKKAFGRAAVFFDKPKQFILDVASGPIGLPEYIALSQKFEYRVCMDISVNALLQAKRNLELAGQKGIYICADICNIPLKDNSMDTVLSQHTVYHIPKDEQKMAIEQMYRVLCPGRKMVIVYSWFYHSWFMNISLNVVQIYRIIRHLAGKIYVRYFASKPRLYFYVHSPSWFEKSFSFSNEIDFFCWRSTNKYFMNMYIHSWLGGKAILKKLTQWEEKYSRFMGRFGEYPAIVITKKA
jgi:ubiquinone/menaquinone biosynthesis C-methylase UbiE